MTTVLKRVPVYIVDEHNEAFYCWYRAKSEGYVTELLDLFHIDAHADMGGPQSFRTSLYHQGDLSNDPLTYYRDFAAKELGNGSFIIPAVLVGLVRNVYFVYPKWRHYKPRRRKCNVASVFGEGKRLKYNVKAAEKMQATLDKALPDTKNFNFSTGDIDRIPKKRNIILDIDLDYFACRDSILNQYCYELEITAEQFREKERFLEDRTIAFARLHFDFLKKNDRYFVRIAHQKERDTAYLPSKVEIVSEIDMLMGALKSKQINPAVVTIARSCISGYCPQEYVEWIEAELVQQLKSLLEERVWIVTDGEK